MLGFNMIDGQLAPRVQWLSTIAVARELGVSPATVKRWADRGLLHAARTAGGHRRIDVAELERFRKVMVAQRDVLALWVKKTLLGDPDGAVAAALRAEHERLGAWYRVADSLTLVAQDLVAALDGDAAAARTAAERLGRALARCSGALAPRPEAPRVILTTPEVDGLGLDLALVELCMRERGWNAFWWGAGAQRAEEIADAVSRGEAEAVADSATSRCPPDVLWRELDGLLVACERSGVALVLGGDAEWPARARYVHRERTYSRLQAWMVDYEQRAGGVSLGH